MRRSPPWLALVVLLLGVIILREPRAQRLDDVFLSWFLEQSTGGLPPSAVTLVEIGADDRQQFSAAPQTRTPKKGEVPRRSLSPLEYALFIQAVLNFQPAVVGFEPIVLWRAQEKGNEQVFIDQAMRVPKLLVAMELGEKGARDLTVEDVPAFPHVTGERDGLAEFVGVSHRPNDDIRLIATPGFINLPPDRSGRIRVPMLFKYRGEVVPSFPLQAIMLWLRATPAEVSVELGAQIVLPNGWKIPLHRDGTITINPLAARSVRHLTLSELLLAAQEHDSHHAPTVDLSGLRNQIVLLRLADDPLQPPNIFATAIATIQNNAYVRRAPWYWEWLVLGALVTLAFFLGRIPLAFTVLGALGLGAGYGVLELSLLSKHQLWLPLLMPLVLLSILVVVRLASAGIREPAPARNRSSEHD